jgi:plasmid stabilization system protein ParE
VKIVWSPLAELRATEAFEYIAEDHPQAAAQWLGRLLESVSTLAELPEQGRVVPELARADIRELILPPYRVIYRRDSKQVIILTVRHSRRKFDASELPP